MPLHLRAKPPAVWAVTAYGLASAVALAIALAGALLAASADAARAQVSGTDPPSVTVTAAHNAVVEGAAARFTLTLGQPAPSGGLTVSFTVSETPGSDFVAAADEGAATASFAQGDTAKTVTVATVADIVDVADGAVTVSLTAGSGYALATPGSASVTVTETFAASVAADDFNDDEIDVSWPVHPQVTSYLVQWRDTSTGVDEAYSETTRLAEAAAGAVTHTISGLTTGKRYGVRVTALRAQAGVDTVLATAPEVQVFRYDFLDVYVDPLPGEARGLRFWWETLTAGDTSYAGFVLRWGPGDVTGQVPTVFADEHQVVISRTDARVLEGAPAVYYDVKHPSIQPDTRYEGQVWGFSEYATSTAPDGDKRSEQDLTHAEITAIAVAPVRGEPDKLDVSWTLGSVAVTAELAAVEHYVVEWKASNATEYSALHRAEVHSGTSHRIENLNAGLAYDVKVTAQTSHPSSPVGDSIVGAGTPGSAQPSRPLQRPQPPSSTPAPALPAGPAGGTETAPSTATVILANGWRPADIAVAAALAARTDDSAVLYTHGDRLSEAARALLREHRPANLIVVGGEAAVDADTARAARQAANRGAPERVEGADRAATAAAAARRAWHGSGSGGSGGGALTLVVANGWSPSDVAAAAALAARTPRAAVAFTAPGGLPEATAALLREFSPARVIITGGERAVPSAVAEAISAAVPAATVERVGGADRVETAAKIAMRALGSSPSSSPSSSDGSSRVTLVVANGWSPPDLGVAAALAARTANSAIIYTHVDQVPQASLDLTAAYQPTSVVLIGGTNAIGAKAASALRAAQPPGGRLIRYEGADRTETAAKVAEASLR